jgi:hypothetical protein
MSLAICEMRTTRTMVQRNMKSVRKDILQAEIWNRNLPNTKDEC